MRPASRLDPGFVIVKPSSLGDIVHALPSFAALRRAHPDSRITWIANTEWLPLLHHVPDLDVVLPFPRSRFRGALTIPRFLRWIQATRRNCEVSGEIVFDLQGLLRSAIIARSRPGSHVIGSRASRELAPLFYHTRAPDPGPCHAVDHCLSIMKAGGIQPPSGQAEFPLGCGDRPGQPLPDHFILVHPYSRGAGKSLAGEDIAVMLERLAPGKVVVVGQAGGAIPRFEKDHITDLTGRTTLGELLWLCRNASAVVSVDSGPLHIAAAVNPRVIGIHTWSDPRRVGPYSSTALVWKAGRLGRVADLSDDDATTNAVPTREDLLEIASAIADS